MNFKSAILALLGLCTFAIAQPLLDTLGHGATFFVAHGAGASEILGFSAVVYLLPVLLLIVVAAILRVFSVQAALLFVSVVLGILAGLWVLGMVSSLSARLAMAIAGGSAVLVAWLYFRREGVRDLLWIVGLLSPLVLVSFLFFTPVKFMVFAQQDDASELRAGKQTPVVMLLLDELSLAAIITPDGEIDAGRLPNFSRLAKMSTWYENTTTVSTQTEKAVPAILSGMRPTSKTQPIYSEFPRNLFTLLASSHSISAMELFTRLCPRSVCDPRRASSPTVFNAKQMYSDLLVIWLHAIFPREWAEQYLPSISNRWRDFNQEEKSGLSDAAAGALNVRMLDSGRDQRQRFSRFLRSIQRGEGAFLTYFHLILPHVPWIYLPDGTAYNGQYAPGESKLRYAWEDDQYLVDLGVQRYALQLEYVDVLLGQMLDKLQRSGQLDEVLLIVVADHGVAFTAGEQRRVPVAATFADVARVPLFIKYPGQVEPARDEREIETIDLLPTIADVLGLPLSPQPDGQSLLAQSRSPVTRRVLEAGEDSSRFEEAMDMKAATERIYRVIEPGKTALAAMGLGAGKQLVGTNVPDAVPRGSGNILHLDNAHWYAEVNPESGFLPARLSGMFSDAAPDTELLFALNGVFAGSGRTFAPQGSLSIMLDPRRFRPGKNDLRAFQLRDGVLSEVSVIGDSGGWSITRNDEDIVSATDANGEIYLPDTGVAGWARWSRPGGDATVIKGYACDEARQLAPLELLLIDDTAVVTAGFHRTGMPVVAVVENVPARLQCWFSLELGAGSWERTKSLTVLALFEDGRMSEVIPDKPGRWGVSQD